MAREERRLMDGVKPISDNELLELKAFMAFMNPEDVPTHIAPLVARLDRIEAIMDRYREGILDIHALAMAQLSVTSKTLLTITKALLAEEFSENGN